VLCNSTAYNIRCASEDSHSVKVQVDGDVVEHLSRIDISWSVQIQNIWYRFAILEFKRPGAIHGSHWAPALTGEPVVRSAQKICQQLTKYAYSFGGPFVGVCDWVHLVLLQLEGDRNRWCNAAEGISARFRWVSDRNEFKRNLYVFLKEALKYFLLANGYAEQ